MSHSWRLVFKRFFGRLVSRRLSRRTFQELSRSLALIVDQEPLAASIAARIRELVDPERLIILRPDEGKTSFLPSFSFGVAAAELAEVQVSARGKLTRWLAANETCLIFDRQQGVQEYLDPAERGLLDRLRLHVCVPMVSLNSLTGILLLGSDRPGWAIHRQEVELLNLLASQASLAFENAALYREQRERLDRLYRAERLAAVGQLAAGVAHEVRNPLTAIRSTMQYLLSGFDPAEPRHQLIREILSEVDRINSTVGDLLSLSRSGELRKAEMDLLAPLGSAVQLVLARAAEQGVALDSEVGDVGGDTGGLPLPVFGDAGQLRQVFLNLLINALQSMPGGGTITIRTGGSFPPSASRARWAEVRIADDGPGIPPDQLRRVFDPFYTTKREGTGIGLAICHGIIEQHKGTIHLESTVGQGTTAFVRLPLSEREV